MTTNNLNSMHRRQRSLRQCPQRTPTINHEENETGSKNGEVGGILPKRPQSQLELRQRFGKNVPYRDRNTTGIPCVPDFIPDILQPHLHAYGAETPRYPLPLIYR